MFNLDAVELDLECPRCGFTNPFWFRQARLRDVVICRGCKVNIQLNDQKNECRKTERSIRRQLAEFEKSLGSLKITIPL